MKAQAAVVPATPASAATWTTYGFLLVTTVVWGGTNIAAKLSLATAPAIGVATARFGVAALCFALLLAVLGRRLKLALRDLPHFAILGLSGVFGSNMLFFLGLSLAPVTDAALIAPSTNPLWTALFAAVLTGERFTHRQQVGMALSLMGVLLIVGAGGFDVSASLQRVQGDLLLLAASASWALYTVLSRPILERYSVLETSAYTSILGALPMLLVAAPLGWDWLVAGPSSLWLAIAYLALLGTVAALLGWYRAVRVIGAARAGQFTYLVPLWALILAAVILGERPHWLQLIGALVVVAGLWHGNRQARVPAARPQGGAG